MAHFTIDTDSVRNKARMVSNLADTYDSLRTRLLETATSAGSAYDSADNRIYVQNITELCKELGQVSERLRNAAQVLQQQSAKYDDAESENAQQARRLS